MLINPLTAKLRHFAQIADDDKAALDDLCVDAQRLPHRKDLIKEGDRPEFVFLLLKGWACRYKILPDGKRQIMAILLPGDLCDVQIFILKKMDHSIGLLGDSTVAAIPKAKMIAIFEERPRLAAAMWWSTLTDEAVLREWLVNIGQRDSYRRLAHLFVELWLRLKAVDLTAFGYFDFPANQADLADMLGLTPVHINRMLQRMRGEGFIETSRGRVRIPDVQKLMELSRFESNYLHLDDVRAPDDLHHGRPG